MSHRVTSRIRHATGPIRAGGRIYGEGMSSLLKDAFDHHSWATLNVLDACAALPPAILEVAVTGTYGTIEATLRHAIESDSYYLDDFYGGWLARQHPSETLSELRELAVAQSQAWSALLEGDLDADEVIHEVDPEDGYQRDATVGLRLAQALHHGNDHRSQICTTMSAHGFTPPPVSVWEYGFFSGRASEILPR